MQENFSNDSIIINIGKEKFKFINFSDGQPIEVILNTDRLYVVTFPVKYPLYSVVLHLKRMYDDEELSYPDTMDTVIESWANQLDKLLDEALVNFKKNDKITIQKAQEATSFMNALELMRELANGIFFKFPEKIQQLTRNSQNPDEDKAKFRHKLIEKLTQRYENSILNFILKVKKSLIIKTKKRGLNETINDFIIDCSFGVAFVYFYGGYFHQAEIHLKNALAFLEKIKDQERIHQHSFPLKLLLAKIYFKFGYFEITLNLIRESQDLVKKKFLVDFDGTLLELIAFLKNELLPFYQDRNVLITLEICQNTVSLIDNVRMQVSIAAQSNPKFFQKIVNAREAIKAIFLQAQDKYYDELRAIAKMKDSRAYKKMIKEIKPGFHQHDLLITLKTSEYQLALFNTFHAFSVQPQIMPGKIQIKVDLYRCSPKLLAKACEKSLTTLEEETRLTKMKAEAKLEVIHPESTILEKPQPIQTPVLAQTARFTFSSEKEPITLPVPIPASVKTPQTTRKKLTTSTTQSVKESSLTVVSDNLPAKPFIPRCDWPKTGLTYTPKKGIKVR